jgi:hypothetical protein
MILIVATNIVIAIASNTFRRAVETITIEYRRFEQEFFTSTQGARFAISALRVFFGIQLLQKIVKILYKFGFHFIRHIINNGTFGII